MRVRKKRSAHPVSNCHVEKEKEAREREREGGGRESDEGRMARRGSDRGKRRNRETRKRAATLAMNNTGNF